MEDGAPSHFVAQCVPIWPVDDRRGWVFLSWLIWPVVWSLFQHCLNEIMCLKACNRLGTNSVIYEIIMNYSMKTRKWRHKMQGWWPWKTLISNHLLRISLGKQKRVLEAIPVIQISLKYQLSFYQTRLAFCIILSLEICLEKLLWFPKCTCVLLCRVL